MDVGIRQSETKGVSMKVIGIIAEYNPFHQGHAYQIKKLKETCHGDYVVIAMSGNFVQRGAPALMEKYSRTKMALSCGADLVLELPTLFATSSAEYFARGGVCLLHSTGIITHLGFGAETDDLDLLTELSAILSNPPSSYENILHKKLKEGLTFPKARANALESCVFSSVLEKSGSFSNTEKNTKNTNVPHLACTAKELAEILASPNNILALEYLKALKAIHSHIIPVPIQRIGKSYHAAEMEADFCSAYAIRAFLEKREDFNSVEHTNWNSDNAVKPNRFLLPETTMPAVSYNILQDYPHPFLYEDDFSPLLHYELLTKDIGSLSAWADSSPDLARRLVRERIHFTNWREFCRHMKTKNITYSRLSRLFLHILLHIRQKEYESFPSPSYLRILGFRKSAQPLLTALKSNSTLPVITRLADASNQLPVQAQHLLELDLRATDLYRLALTAKGDSTLKNDYQQQVIRFSPHD